MSLGTWATVSLDIGATVFLGDWATVSLGDWATVSLGDWAIVNLGTKFHRKVKRRLNQNGLISTQLRIFWITLQTTRKRGVIGM